MANIKEGKNKQISEADDKNEPFHKKHRQRLKTKFKEFGADVLADHELIELLLYYAIPRRNTNYEAHRLIGEFGNLANIMDAGSENIQMTCGLTEHTALLFELLGACVNRYINDKNNIANAMLTPQNINVYIKNLFYGHNNEIAYAILLDKECVVKKIRKLSSGSVNATSIYPREVVKLAVNEKYPYMILAHNHPNGNAMPSENDLRITKTIELALDFVEVRLVDHVIVAGEQVVSLARQFNIFDE